ncbi:MAG: hypothetical protein ABIO88_01680 [Burkholderiaceae bacterium]
MNNKTASFHESQPYVFLHEDAFETYFEPYRHPNTIANVWNDLGLSAHGKDWETLKEVSPDYVWTVIESEGDRWITPGFHVVNRVCYLITKKPHMFLPFEFKSAWRPTSLTSLGLLRQMNKIKRTFAINNIAI